MNNKTPARANVIVLKQILNLIPREMINRHARETGVEDKVRSFRKLSGFLGHSANAVRWQVYAALLVYVLLRFHAHMSNWGHSFTLLFAVTRSALWERLDLPSLLKSYGTSCGVSPSKLRF